MNLEWTEERPGSWFAMSNRSDVGMVIARDDGSVVYKLTAVHWRGITKGSGEVKTLAAGKRAIERAWAAWLDAYGLRPNVPLDEAMPGA